MMNLVNVFVDEFVVEETVTIVEPGVVTQHADQHVQQTRGDIRQLANIPVRSPLAPQTVSTKPRQHPKNNLNNNNT